MTASRNDQGHVRMPEPEFEAILARATLPAGIAIKLKIFGGGPQPRPSPFINSSAPALVAGFSFWRTHGHDLPRSLARRAGELLALAELLFRGTVAMPPPSGSRRFGMN